LDKCCYNRASASEIGLEDLFYENKIFSYRLIEHTLEGGCQRIEDYVSFNASIQYPYSGYIQRKTYSIGGTSKIELHQYEMREDEEKEYVLKLKFSTLEYSEEMACPYDSSLEDTFGF